MDIFGILTMVGGLALFLFGMNVMGDGLTQLSGGRLEQILEKLTSKRIMAVLLGAVVTAVIQSSSATTVMVVGFVNSGIMKLNQAVGIIMGANIGTTVTAWLLSLTGIEGSNFLLQMCKPKNFSPILALIGIVLYMSKKSDNKKNVGTILLGFATLMFGMEQMSGAVAPLADNPAFTSILTMFSIPILGILAGALLTAVIQSSSASVGILQALCSTGAIRYNIAIPIIMGQNIGTCVTAIISSIGANINARRTAMIHLFFNIIGSVIFMVVFYGSNLIFHYAFLDTIASPASIALIHSIFNIACVLVMLPISDWLVKLATLIVPDKQVEQKEEDRVTVLDQRFLDQPGFAVKLCKDAVAQMAHLSRKAFLLAIDNLKDPSDEKRKKVYQLEEKVDLYEDELNTYLVKLSSQNLSNDDSKELSFLLHCVNDFERISDHSINVVDSSDEIIKNKIKMSEKALVDLDIFASSIKDILDLTIEIFDEMNPDRAKEIQPLEEIVDKLSDEMKKRHIMRLRSGECSLEAGLVLEDLIISYERVGDHCSNVSKHMMAMDDLVLDASWFKDEYNKIKDTYVLP
ncbi:MAG: Na/Pi cotransporter family protein [Erysipelotrichaceae bacterium]|uniref:Na/Pi cotransporter family protein n=1 Tax=Floccifex sp. TaxID=2815810 RepID=UPI002A757DCE|nr:Na/Pi cotransporter family protein [Floccifex sp.]MDD7280493.1 Na/Pi cotransporter family protein [Erysipelotrichaceae bacterium]MDY2958553.1 Na/Pi cotransporter family protein [Floccifex sp.]